MWRRAATVTMPALVCLVLGINTSFVFEDEVQKDIQAQWHEGNLTTQDETHCSDRHYAWIYYFYVLLVIDDAFAKHKVAM